MAQYYLEVETTASGDAVVVVGDHLTVWQRLPDGKMTAVGQGYLPCDTGVATLARTWDDEDVLVIAGGREALLSELMASCLD
jgi:hypothetical protein